MLASVIFLVEGGDARKNEDYQVLTLMVVFAANSVMGQSK